MRIPRPLYHFGWGWMLAHTFLLIAHQGRRTGKRHETVAMALKHDPDCAYAWLMLHRSLEKWGRPGAAPRVRRAALALLGLGAGWVGYASLPHILAWGPVLLVLLA